MERADKQTKQKKAAVGTGRQIEVELVRSTCNTPDWMRTIVRTLGLRKMRDKSTFNDNPAIRGMVRKVPHLVELREKGE